MGEDARDALHLARLLKLGEIVEVTIPGVEQEAARDLVRGREDASADVMRATHRVSKLLLRHGIVYSSGSAWTQTHDRWLRAQAFESPAIQIVFDSSYEAMLLTVDRRDRLDAQIVKMANDSEFTSTVRRLSCLRGVSSMGLPRLWLTPDLRERARGEQLVEGISSQDVPQLFPSIRPVDQSR